MKLKVINSGSDGNCYILTSNSGKRLIIECGVKWSEIQKAINFEYSSVSACLLSHEHLDHSKSVSNIMQHNIKVLAPQKTAEKLGFDKRKLFIPSNEDDLIQFSGGFKVTPFNVFHDVDTVGYLIYHEECGLIVFATDTSKMPFNFPGVNHFIIESNYCMYKLADDRLNGFGNEYVSDRVERTHLSFQQAKHLINDNFTSDIQSITLIHLSNTNADAGCFRDEIINEFGVPCFIASPDLEISLNLYL